MFLSSSCIGGYFFNLPAALPLPMRRRPPQCSIRERYLYTILSGSSSKMTRSRSNRSMASERPISPIR